MKLRIRDNTIRLRLTQGEVEAMRQSGEVAASCGFPGSRKLRYRLEASPASVRPEAFLTETEITVRLPESLAGDWASSDKVSISGDQELEDGGTLSILVEKDFACLTPREGEDESDMFPHPDADTKEC